MNRLTLIGALLSFVTGLVVPLRGDELYVTNPDNNTIEKFDPNNSMGSTFASGYFASIAFDSAGNLYAACPLGLIEKFDSNGVGSVFASTGLNGPVGIAFDGAGNLYVANHPASGGGSTIEKFNSNGVGSVFATGLNVPYGLAFDKAGNLYVANAGNSIEKFNSSGVGSVFASGLNFPTGIAFDSEGNLYESNRNNTIEKFNSSGVGSVFASAGLNDPAGIAFDSAGNLYAANFGGGTIEKFDSNGVGSVVDYAPSPYFIAFAPNANPVPNNLAWIQPGSGSWNNPGNWNGNKVPGSNPQDTACFGTVIGSNTATVTLDGSWTIGGLAFSTTGGGSYVLSRSASDITSTLTLAGSGGSFVLSNSGGNHTIAVPVVLANNLSVTAATGSTLTISGPVSESGGSQSVAVNGGGTLALTGNNTYTGCTTISVGTLKLAAPVVNNIASSPTITVYSGATLDVTGLSGGAITLASGQTLAGSGTVAGGVVAANGSHVAPGGSTVGTLSVGSLSLNSGSVLDYQFNGLSNSLLNVTTPGGLTINGAGFDLYTQGTLLSFATPGTYKMLQYSGALGGSGTSALSVLNPAPGMSYTFSTSAGAVDLNIQPATRDTISFYDDSTSLLDTGHAFLQMIPASETGVAGGYRGFYPPYKSPFFALSPLPGYINDDQGHQWQYKISYAVTDAQYNAAVSVINHDEQSPPNYNALVFNCVDWISRIAAAAGVNLPATKDVFPSVSDPRKFGISLATIGTGGTYSGGTVSSNSAPATKALSPLTGATPQDYSFLGMENTGHTAPTDLASLLSLPLDTVSVGSVNANILSGISVDLLGADPTASMISVDWGDGSAFDAQAVNFSHVYSPGSYDADLLVVDAGAVHYYDFMVSVSSGPAGALTLNLSAFPPANVPNGSLVSGDPLSVVPEPSSLALLAAGAIGLVGYGWRLRAVRRTAKSALGQSQDDAPAILSFPSHSSPAHVARRAA